MVLFGICSTYIMKSFFLSVIFLSVIVFVLRLVHHIHPIYEDMPKLQTVPKKEPTPLEKLLLNLSQEDMELVGMLKSVLIQAPRGKYNFNRGEAPFQEHVLERAVRQLNMLHVEDSKKGAIMYSSKYDGNPGLYCRDKRANRLRLEYEPWDSFVEEVTRCEDGVISITHRRTEHVGAVCLRMKETLENIGKPRGFFVEVGAADGETRSPTLCLEVEDHWGGLMIEADPRFWLHLRAKRRKVSLGLTCVGLTNVSYVGRLGLKDPTQSKLIEVWDKGFTELVEVNCYPLYTYFLAVYRTVIDFLVVNINGHELDVLKTLPWDKITIYIIAVCYGTKRERTELNDYLVNKGYHLHRRYHQEGESFLMFVRLQNSE